MWSRPADETWTKPLYRSDQGHCVFCCSIFKFYLFAITNSAMRVLQCILWTHFWSKCIYACACTCIIQYLYSHSSQQTKHLSKYESRQKLISDASHQDVISDLWLSAFFLLHDFYTITLTIIWSCSNPQSLTSDVQCIPVCIYCVLLMLFTMILFPVNPLTIGNDKNL